MSDRNPDVTATEHQRDDGSTEVDVVILLAGHVHPDTPVTPTDTPDAPPVPAGTLDPSTQVAAPASAAPDNSAPAPGAVPGANSAQGPFDPPPPPDGSSVPVDTGPTAAPADVTTAHGAGPDEQPDAPKTTTAGAVSASGDAGSSTVVQRVDDPEKTPVPAGDLDASTVVHDPAAGPVHTGRGPVTAAELAGYPWPDNGPLHALNSEHFGQLLAELDAAGYVVGRK